MNILQSRKLFASRVITRQVAVIFLPPAISTRHDSDSGHSKNILTTQDGKPKHNTTLPQYHLSNIDRLTLQLFGNIKGDIPKEVSYAVMEKAESKRRIAVNLFLMAFCGFGSMYVVYNVKKDLKDETEGNIYARNTKRYEQDAKKEN